MIYFHIRRSGSDVKKKKNAGREYAKRFISNGAENRSFREDAFYYKHTMINGNYVEQKY